MEYLEKLMADDLVRITCWHKDRWIAGGKEEGSCYIAYFFTVYEKKRYAKKTRIVGKYSSLENALIKMIEED